MLLCGCHFHSHAHEPCAHNHHMPPHLPPPPLPPCLCCSQSIPSPLCGLALCLCCFQSSPCPRPAGPMQAAQQHRQTHLGPGCCCAPCLYCSQGLAARGAYAARAHPLPAGPPGSAEEGGIQWGTAAHCFAMAAKVQYFAMAAEAHNFAVAGQAHSFAIALLVAPAPSEGALGLVKRRLWLCRRRATAWGGHNHWSAHLPGACNRLLHQGRGLGESCCCNRQCCCCPPCCCSCPCCGWLVLAKQGQDCGEVAKGVGCFPCFRCCCCQSFLLWGQGYAELWGCKQLQCCAQHLVWCACLLQE
mmetsp:Transcript_30402/g.79099  ORF Transcript_30402/g.79099 Transcript_30402/m.79099 type:complete len:301 (-) Transcript_30402:119-1021(-)